MQYGLYDKILKNKFSNDKDYIIRLCRISEFNRISKFINNFWKKNHIFVKNKKLFYWQHKQFNQINFLIAEHKKTKNIHGILGLVSKNFFRYSKIRKKDDIWIAIIKVEKSFNTPRGLGTSLIKFLVKKYEPKTLSALGISKEIVRLYEFLGFKIDNLKQFYIKNYFIKKFKIAQFEKNTKIKEIPKNSNFNLNKVSKVYLERNKKIINKLDTDKNYSYLKKRFIDHPIYKYIFFSITKNGQIFSLFIARILRVKKSKCLRIIDIINLDKSLKIEFQFLEYMKKNNFEYIDLIYFGSRKKILTKIGFKEKNNKMILPNYFEPFFKENITTLIAYLSKKYFEIFKADSDLDRPSKIR